MNKVVIIGHSYTSRLSIIRSVAVVCGDITVIDMNGKNARKPIDGYSRYVTRVFHCDRTDACGLITILLNHCTDQNNKVVLIPDSDFSAATIDLHREELKKYFVFPYINNVENDSIAFWMDKMNQKVLAKKVGLNVANAVILDRESLFSITSNITYPCLSKALATINGGKSLMRVSNTRKELEKALLFVLKERENCTHILVEDYKNIQREFALLGFSDGTSVMIPAIMELLVISQANKGIALQGKVLPIDGFETLIEKFKQFVLQMGFVGVFDIDFFLSGGEYYFCEMNLRFGGSGYSVTKMGANLPEKLVRYLGGEEVEEVIPIKSTATYTNDKMCMDDLLKGYISFNDMRSYLKKSDIRFIKDNIDKRPQKVFMLRLIEALVRKNLRTLLSKN